MLAGPETPVATDYLVARAVNAILGSTAVLLAALIARSLAGLGAGLIAALVIAVHPSFVATSSLASTDTPYTTAALLSLWLMVIARNPIRFGLIQISLLAALVAFLTKYQALPLVGLPFLVMFFGRSDPRFGRHLTAAVILTAGVALWLHFIYDIYQVQQQHVYKFPDTDTPGLVTKDNLLIPISLGEGVTRLLVGLEPPYLLVTVFFGLLAASIRPLGKRPDGLDRYRPDRAVRRFLHALDVSFPAHGIGLLATGDRFPMYPLGRRGRLRSETALPDGYRSASDGAVFLKAFPSGPQGSFLVR